MAIAGDYYEVTLSKSHLEWGTHRYTNSRDMISGEGYIPIPLNKAREFQILNGNGTGGHDIWGKNLYECRSIDGYFEGVLRAQGCNNGGDIYAKQFSADGDLKAIGSWYNSIGASIGNVVRVSWVSPTQVEIELI